ncbi:glucosamine--fructose-6-phosphate aminotransferase (isomerizing) [Microbacterium sp. ru370.1]|uniref:glutamine--fructose-6-phosphate transaminase (isomerizing) n=1 Tax=unclassified Microbacterium TaxID=2609290 RepID=UPI0008809670|nr:MULTISPECIES: glutamine--fructose-6-phosphate transaminase (isomerizing) [unclassified Microbacterium]SDO72781.1 glucosamine--fructose-6-phosphate aminotransferase (isomerizing) [Microbacterium sp. ru370.1]SIT87671.1 glucosamine--fructose-6-phosphate aminotransferase (isomerizing) [Microbacterium sp. RU1D]
MCGITAYHGLAGAASRARSALERLEYRGYDSAGIAARRPDGTTLHARTLSGVAALAVVTGEQAMDATTAAIGHTRWATHGEVSEANAHPLEDCSGRLYVVHNGIVDNADALRSQLVAAGHRFATGVDSEVIVHLIEQAQRPGVGLGDALADAVAQLSGSWAVVALDTRSGTLAATAHGSPLIHAEGAGGTFLASDVGAVAPDVAEFRVLEDDDVVEVDAAGTRWHRAGGSCRPRGLWPVPRTALLASTGRHRDHMGNEIDEQPAVARRVIEALAPGIADGRLWHGLGLPSLDGVDRVAVLGCGTSLHAGRAVAGVFAHLGGLPTRTLVASEAAHEIWEPRTLVVAMSQSGETADVLRALDALPARHGAVLALTNNTSSTLARRADAVIDCLAGPEVGVAATKTFVAQVLTGVCVALSGLASADRGDSAGVDADLRALAATPDALSAALDAWRAPCAQLAAEYARASGFLFLGRGTGLVYAAEGALKLKELSYRWAESHAAGELKHGPLALVGAGTPVFVVDSGDPRLDVDIAEVTARGGRVIRIGERVLNVGGVPLHLPRTGPSWGPLESVIPLQMFARELALRLHRNVDKPRNLAKSVTVS